ncbi:transglycosylase family protein [Raineyella sp. LH-20]|uniref:transglycosylase family protein n=1 Tax=Raineyella sp. LH-20 TaxID=3081204 RepID=UPI0029553AD1|nr:transglycosylase family protein [Raineyella sp. LH-20]WOP17230.1 transglycosylase family protein [Raineyella sp. LH-20]
MTSKTMTRTLGALVGLSALALGVPAATAHAAPAQTRSSQVSTTSSSTGTATASSSATGRSTTTTIRTARTTVNLNVRTGPSLDNQRLTTLPKGTRVTLTGAKTEHWTQISYQGKHRWVASRYLTPATTSVISTGSSAKTTTAKKSSTSTTKASASTTKATAATRSGSTTQAAASGSTVWDRLAQCESGGNWSINTGNGFSGGLQFTPSTWSAYGGTGSASTASRAEQIAVAQRVQASQGWGAWPACSSKLGLR